MTTGMGVQRSDHRLREYKGVTTGTGVQRSDQEYVMSLIHENGRF